MSQFHGGNVRDECGGGRIWRRNRQEREDVLGARRMDERGDGRLGGMLMLPGAPWLGQ